MKERRADRLALVRRLLPRLLGRIGTGAETESLIEGKTRIETESQTGTEKETGTETEIEREIGIVRGAEIGTGKEIAEDEYERLEFWLDKQTSYSNLASTCWNISTIGIDIFEPKQLERLLCY